MTDAVPDFETKAAFARRLGVKRQYVQKLVSRGLPVADDGRVPVADAIDWLARNTSTAAAQVDGKTPSLVEVKTRLILVQIEKEKTNLERLRGSTIDKEDARRAVRTFARNHRDHMLRFPSRYGAQMAAELGIDPAPLIAILEFKMRVALKEAAEDPIPFEAAVDG